MKPFPFIAYGTPRKLPKSTKLPGRVVVLDVAFASKAGGASFEKTTLPFINGLGDRLALWVDHHDHDRHVDYKNDPRFVLHTKAEHGACPEIITEEMVERAGDIDTVCCHVDFDGICAAAKWIRGGIEPYEGADLDAYAVDTRLGTPSERGALLDRVLRGNPRDDGLRGLMLRFLVDGGTDRGMIQTFKDASRALLSKERESEKLAARYDIRGHVAVCDASVRDGAYEKTHLLLLGQKLAPISLVYDDTTVTAAARFDSGVNLVELFELGGGMPTRVSVQRKKLDWALEKLRGYELPGQARSQADTAVSKTAPTAKKSNS